MQGNLFFRIFRATNLSVKHIIIRPSRREILMDFRPRRGCTRLVWYIGGWVVVVVVVWVYIYNI